MSPCDNTSNCNSNQLNNLTPNNFLRSGFHRDTKRYPLRDVYRLSVHAIDEIDRCIQPDTFSSDEIHDNVIEAGGGCRSSRDEAGARI